MLCFAIFIIVKRLKPQVRLNKREKYDFLVDCFHYKVYVQSCLYQDKTYNIDNDNAEL